MKNSVSLIGNVGQDPKVRVLDSGKKVCNFSLATAESYKKDGERITNTTWHNSTMWSPVAEIAEKYVKKGSLIAVDGKIVNRSYEDKEGRTRDITEIICNNILLLNTREKSETKDPENNEGTYQKSGKVDMKSLSDPAELDPSYEPPFQ